jgi:hypothetical protein
MFNIANNQDFLMALGIADLPEETKAPLIEGLEASAQSRLVLKLEERLTDEQAEQLGAIDDDQQMSDWLRANVPDFLFLVSDVLSEMQQEILSAKQNIIGA